MHRAFLRWTSLFGFTSVLLGAFGAHALSSRWNPERLAVFQTGVHYQLTHTLALLGVTLLLKTNGQPSQKQLVFSGFSFILGILLFSGSLYLLTFTQIKALGIITPFGGLLLMCGWIALGASTFLNRQSR